MASTHSVFTGTPQDLEAQLVASVAQLKRKDPLQPLLVLVPNRAAGTHVMEMLSKDTAIIGVSVTTLEAAAREIVQRGGGGGSGLELPAGAERLVTSALLAKPQESDECVDFGELAGRPGFLRGLSATLRDLFDADVSGTEVDSASDNLTRLLQLHAAHKELRSELSIDDDSARLAAAAIQLEAEEAKSREHALCPIGPCGLFLFGVYDPTGLQARFIVAAARTAHSFVALLPEHTFASHFGLRLCAALELAPVQLDLAGARAETSGVGLGEIAALRAAWRDESGTARPQVQRDGSVEVLSMPDGVAGARLLAREVLELLNPGDLDPREVLLVSRGDGGMSQELVARELRQLGVPVGSSGISLGASRVGRPLLALADVLASPRVSRGRLLDVLCDWPWRLDGVAIGEHPEPTVIDAAELARWDRITRDANLRMLVATAPVEAETQGDESTDFAGEIQKRLSYEAHRRERLASSAEEQGSARTADLRQSAKSTATLASVVRRIANLHRDLTRGMSWHECAGRLRGILEVWTSPDATGHADWLGRLGGLGKLDKLGVGARGTRLVWILRGLGAETVREEGAELSGVRFAPLARMRGARPQVVILLNGIESCFPRPPKPDSLLPSADRQLLAQSAPTLANHELEEERALFGELLAMPMRKLVLVTTFEGLETGRGSTPSRFLLNALGVLCGGPEPSTEMVAEGKGGVRKIALQEAWTQTPQDAPDEELRVLGGLHEGLSAGWTAPALRELLSEFRPAMQAALAMEHARIGRPGYTAFDGELSAQVTEQLAAHGAFRGSSPEASVGSPISVSRLETYAGCGMKSFLQSVLGLREHDRPEDSRGINAAERGQRVHEILEVFGLKCEAAELLPWRPSDTAKHRELLEASIAEVIERVLRSAPENQRSLWEAERQRYNGLLRRWLRGETKSEELLDWVPTAFEWDFKGHQVELGDGGAPLWFRGRVDRVDIATSPGGTREVRIVDYKTGSSGDYQDDVTDSGKNLQLFLYGVAAERKFAGANSVGTYDFVFAGSQTRWSGICDHRKPTKVRPKETSHTALRQVAALAHGMEAGHFAPLPREKGKVDVGGCSYCAMAEACGPWRATIIASRGKDDPVGTALLEALDDPDSPGFPNGGDGQAAGACK
jgi:RecB family exonuclease